AGDEDTDATLATLLALDGLPAELRLLLAAQQAGRRGEHALQADQARAAMAAAGTRLPVLADLARVQLAQSERAGGNAAAAAGLLREALAGLQRSGRLDHAAEVAIALAGLDLQGGDH